MTCPARRVFTGLSTICAFGAIGAVALLVSTAQAGLLGCTPRGRPIISLTAKAMKSDRDKAIAAGASEYMAKPVDVDQLVSMMRAWLDPRP